MRTVALGTVSYAGYLNTFARGSSFGLLFFDFIQSLCMVYKR